jgi:hypothetical protein
MRAPVKDGKGASTKIKLKKPITDRLKNKRLSGKDSWNKWKN